jgi:hypothetical protein
MFEGMVYEGRDGTSAAQVVVVDVDDVDVFVVVAKMKMERGWEEELSSRAAYSLPMTRDSTNPVPV